MHTRNIFSHKSIAIASLSIGSLIQSTFAEEPVADMVILDEISTRNLGIETVEADYRDFTETLFAIGRIEPIPSRKSVISSRIPGRVIKLAAFEGDIVEANAPIVDIESLQPGNPPPTISLKAPLPGMVMRSHTHVGKPVVPDTELFEIIDLTEVYAVARIPEDQVGKLAIGTRAQIRVAAIPSQNFEGKLARFGTEANPVNGTFDAFFILDNPDFKVRPNMRVEFSVVLETRTNTMSIPRGALQTDGINRVVFVKDFDLPNAFIKSQVKVGAQNEQYAEILSGLFPGDEVVTQGSYTLMFAGGGGVSLKAALDAAHGHEHNEDGSEMTASQKAEEASAHEGDGGDRGPLTLFLGILSALLAILLLLSLLIKRSPANAN
jgi:cobalt-zinc-cadmium efflux system membrane fusion protein